MESVLGFMETRSDIVVDDQSCGYKLVPWISWDDWSFVRDSLLSSSPDSIAPALRRISAWRSRGCVPVAIEITASIIEVQQKDPFFRDDVTDNALHSEEMLAMLYCMAIMRLVNGIVEKTRNKTEVSIGEAADAIGIPRMLIDIRHEGSHRDLPSLRLVRLASVKVSNFIYNHGWVLNLMRENTKKELIQPAATRFATAFLTLQSMYSLKQPLVEMFASSQWAKSTWAKKSEGKQVKKIILHDRSFWGSVAYAIKTTKPLVSVLRMTDSEKMPGMGFIYGAMDKAKEDIQTNLGGVGGAHTEIWSIIDDKWEYQLHRHLHAAAYFLKNPHYQYEDNFSTHPEVKLGLLTCMEKLIPNSKERMKADLQIDDFRNRKGLFGFAQAKATYKQRSPADWWLQFGDGTPELTSFAVKILSLTCSSSACERNWSTFNQALDWLKSYYWETQKMAIPSDRTANLRKEIKSALHELAFCLKINQTSVSSSSASKGKRVRHCEHLCGRNKLLSLMAGKLQSSKPSGSKKQITKTLKKFLRLYSSFSSEVVSVLLEFLLKALDSANLEELPKVGDRTSRLQTAIDDWKPVIVKLSNKEPEFILSLLKAVLEMIETREAVKFELGDHLTSEYRAEFLSIEQLSYLFEWLVGNLKGLKLISHKGFAAETEGSSTELNLPKTTLVEFLRKCLIVSSPENNRLTTSALVLAHMIGNNTLLEKINKLALLHSSNLDFNEENTSENFLSQQEDSIHQAAEKLEFFKHHHVKSNNANTSDGDGENKNRWVVVKSWNPCPIGMLPCAVGSSGLLPVLDCDDDPKQGKMLSESKEKWGLKQYSGKREAECAAEFLDGSSAKKMKESEGGLESNDKEDDPLLEGVKGQLMIGGVWKKAREEEVLSIASAVRILV